MSTAPGFPPAQQAARVIEAREALARAQREADAILGRIQHAQARLEEEASLLRHLTGHPDAVAPDALFADAAWCLAVMERLVWPHLLGRSVAIGTLVRLASPGRPPEGMFARIHALQVDPLRLAMPAPAPPAPPPGACG